MPFFAAIASWWGGLAAWGQQLLVALALMTVSYALTPRPKSQAPAAVTQGEIPSADEGGSIPVIFGTVRLKQTCILATHGHRTTAIRVKA